MPSAAGDRRAAHPHRSGTAHPGRVLRPGRRGVRARTRRELEKVSKACRPAWSPPAPWSRPVPAVSEGSPAKRKRLIAIMNGSNTRGRWRHRRRSRLRLHGRGEGRPAVRGVRTRGSSTSSPGHHGIGRRGRAGGRRGRARRHGGHGRQWRPHPAARSAAGHAVVRVHARGLWGGVGARTGKPRGERRDRDGTATAAAARAHARAGCPADPDPTAAASVAGCRT
jgi:hypothetical protein